MNVDTSSEINVLSICSGVGGLDLGLELATGGAARSVCFVEREAFCAAILASRMEDKVLAEAPIWSDLRTFDGKLWRGVVDLITGGYPCQPFSSAGKRLGEHDPRHLWPEIRRIIEEIKPRFVFFENVSGHLTLGLSDVLGDLARMGFRCSTGLFTAEEVGAPHRRERVFILGIRQDVGMGNSANDNRRSGESTTKTGTGPQGERWWRSAITGARMADTNGDSSKESRSIGEKSWQPESFECNCGELANAKCNRSQGECDPWSTQGSVGRSSGAIFPPGPADLEQWRRIVEADPGLAPAISAVADTVSLRSRGRDNETDGGQSGEVQARRSGGESQATEPRVRRVDDGLASRVDRLRACGNGVVPLVAAYAFTTLLACIEE